MAFKVSEGKVAVSLKIPELNYEILKEEVGSDTGGVSRLINRIVEEWLRSKNYEPVEYEDGRGGSWVTVAEIDGKEVEVKVKRKKIGGSNVGRKQE